MPLSKPAEFDWQANAQAASNAIAAMVARVREAQREQQDRQAEPAQIDARVGVSAP